MRLLVKIDYELQRWREYAERKSAWESQNPNANQEEYDKFIDDLTAELGI